MGLKGKYASTYDETVHSNGLVTVAERNSKPMASKTGRLDSKRRLIAAHTLAILLPPPLAVALGWMFLDEFHPVLALSVAAGVAAFGAISAENLGDAIITGVIISLISVIALFFLPLNPLWQQVWVSAWTGLCGGRIILGTYNEFFHHKEYGNVQE